MYLLLCSLSWGMVFQSHRLRRPLVVRRRGGVGGGLGYGVLSSLVLGIWVRFCRVWGGSLQVDELVGGGKTCEMWIEAGGHTRGLVGGCHRELGALLWYEWDGLCYDVV